MYVSLVEKVYRYTPSYIPFLSGRTFIMLPFLAAIIYIVRLSGFIWKGINNKIDSTKKAVGEISSVRDIQIRTTKVRLYTYWIMCIIWISKQTFSFRAAASCASYGRSVTFIKHEVCICIFVLHNHWRGCTLQQKKKVQFLHTAVHANKDTLVLTGGQYFLLKLEHFS